LIKCPLNKNLNVPKVQDPDNDLVVAVQHRTDRGAFEKLLDRYQEKVYQFCFRFTGNEEDAADCSQDIFIKLYQGVGQFNHKSKFSTWLYRIMINTCQDMVKSKAYRYRHRTVDIEQPEENSAGIQVPAGESSDPEKTMQHKEIQIYFQKALMKLKEIQRIVLIMRDVEGRSYGEIARATRLNTGTVRSTLARARYSMAEQLKIFRDEL
jgi:RNA polymerase sigma-70 factor (ECF subfamily)